MRKAEQRWRGWLVVFGDIAWLVKKVPKIIQRSVVISMYFMHFHAFSCIFSHASHDIHRLIYFYPGMGRKGLLA